MCQPFAWLAISPKPALNGPMTAPSSLPSSLPRLQQSPRDPAFVQAPYLFYDRVRQAGRVVFWEDWGLPVTAHSTVVGGCLRDRRLGRAAPAGFGTTPAAHLAPFYDLEAHSMLELDGPPHAKLRAQVLRAFTSRRIAALAPEIEALCHQLIDALPEGGCDLLPHYAQHVPAIIIARLLGLDDATAPDLLRWSHAMVGMYQARRSPEVETAAVAASLEFGAFLRGQMAKRRLSPADDLLSALLATETDEDRGLSEAEILSTAILLLNAGHEATVHSLGNALAQLLRQPQLWAASQEAADNAPALAALVEEALRFDPPLHLFLRWVKEDMEIGTQVFARGERIGLLLAGANRDPAIWYDPDRFDPQRPGKPHHAFGAGAHFCLGAPLARMEMQIALKVLIQRLPRLTLTEPPAYADLYPFHGLNTLKVHY
ncbi:cytochrome P450 [Thioclava sp. GXIMD4216]|uniref:cytochrome P450 n=1 Tax=Thioclava sp. GXIMD4216 TaxID=3131929 RepID=UPI0030D2A23C